ncbi:hypothetical protein QQF64_022734 [Cirrhinus molitorella]|uniref:Olfactomedin-like domain-containing protein n=1 Tax=Cirrhinus molitorella TaxID=172907 RepID=A0ABR3L3D4_9TELE
MSQSHILTLMVTIPLILSQTVRGENCVCELQNSDPAFPENKLNHVDFTAIQCARNVTSEKMTEIDRLVLGLQHRIRQLLDNVSMLEREDNGNLYAAVSLRIIELELAEIQDLLDKLNQTTNNYQQLSVQAAEEFQDMMDTMTELEKFDHVQVMVKQRENELIKRDLERCKEELNSTSPAPTLFPGHCGLGHVVNVSVPKTYSLTEYGTSYTYGAWGRDANPAPGNENKYWLVVLTSSNAYGNFIRQYSSLSAIMLGLLRGTCKFEGLRRSTLSTVGPWRKVGVLLHRSPQFLRDVWLPDVAGLTMSHPQVHRTLYLWCGAWMHG